MKNRTYSETDFQEESKCDMNTDKIISQSALHYIEFYHSESR